MRFESHGGRRYYFRKEGSSSSSISSSSESLVTTPRDSNQRKYYLRPKSSSTSKVNKTDKASNFIQNIALSTLSSFADLMEKTASKYFSHIPHSGRYPGKEDPLSGDPYPWKANSEKQKTDVSNVISDTPANYIEKQEINIANNVFKDNTNYHAELRGTTGNEDSSSKFQSKPHYGNVSVDHQRPKSVNNRSIRNPGTVRLSEAGQKTKVALESSLYLNKRRLGNTKLSQNVVKSSYFRKYEIVHSKFNVKEMTDKTLGVSQKNSMHFPESSIHHSSFHEFHERPPSFEHPLVGEPKDKTESILQTNTLNKWGKRVGNGFLAFIVNDPHNQDSEYLVSKNTLMESGFVYNKLVNMSGWNTNAEGKVKIVNKKTIELSDLQLDGTGSLRWIAGAEFPIQMGHHVTTLGFWSPSTSHQVLVLPSELFISDLRWLALYCKSCNEKEKIVMEVYIPEDFL